MTRTEPPSPDVIYARTMLGAMLMLRSGTTSCVDFLYEAPEITLETLEPVVQAYRDAGMRATILMGVADRSFADSLPLNEDEARRVGRRGGGALTGPHPGDRPRGRGPLARALTG